MPRRFNCCVFNHPCPIFCPINLQCSNEVVNPIISGPFAFISNNAVGEIASQGIIPLPITNYLALMPANGGVVLPAGTFEVSYFAGATVPASGQISVSLTLDGLTLSGSTISATSTAGNNVNSNRTIVISAPAGGVLQLINSGESAVTFSFASMFVKQL